MSSLTPLPSPSQLKVWEVVQRINMARVTLWVVLGAFVVVLIALLVAAFTNLAGPRIEWAFGAIDGLLALCLRQIVKYLFPVK
jgi:hypothetical protein